MILEEIVTIYETKMPKVAIMLPRAEALEYFERLMINGNILTYVKDGELLGFCEFWRVDYSQFGRLCCNITLAHDEDLLNGNIALITRMYIVPDKRNSEVFMTLAAQFLSRNKDCTHFAAFQQQKIHKPVQVYTRDQIIKHFK